MEKYTSKEAIQVTNVYVGVKRLGKTKNQVAKENKISLIAVGMILKKEIYKDITDHIDSVLYNM